MRAVHKVTGMAVILFTLAGCVNGAITSTSPSNTPSTSASGTHLLVVVPILPACEATLTRLAKSGPANRSGSRIPEAVPGPMRLCRYRPGRGLGNNLALFADIPLPLAPVALLHTLKSTKDSERGVWP